jgi:hypothetical protein
MHYIRFLKPPKLQGSSIKTLITITSDLGESFLPDDVQLSASLRSADGHGEIYLRKSLKWTSSSRSLSVVFNIRDSDIEWPARVHVTQRNAPLIDRFEKHHNGGDLPPIISAWSDVLDPKDGINEASKTVERRFSPLNDRILSIWEETGESIARHIWYDSTYLGTLHLVLTNTPLGMRVLH